MHTNQQIQACTLEEISLTAASVILSLGVGSGCSGKWLGEGSLCRVGVSVFNVFTLCSLNRNNNIPELGLHILMLMHSHMYRKHNHILIIYIYWRCQIPQHVIIQNLAIGYFQHIIGCHTFFKCITVNSKRLHTLQSIAILIFNVIILSIYWTTDLSSYHKCDNISVAYVI